MFVPPHLIGNAAGHDRVVSTMRLDVTETAAANIARKGGVAIVDLLEPHG